MPITLDAITREINANGYALAKMIRGQMDTRDDRAAQIVNAYDGAVNGSPEAEAVVLNLYDAWRNDHASVVAPIAESIGNPLPAGVSGNGTPAEPPAFWAPSSTATEAVSEAVEPSAAPEPTPSAAPAAGAAQKPKEGRKPRAAWTQADIVKLTLGLNPATCKPSEVDTTIGALAEALNREPAEVRTKAAELGLIELPKTEKYELSDSDKGVLRKRLINVVADNLPLEQKIAQFKYVAAEAREICKEITG